MFPMRRSILYSLRFRPSTDKVDNFIRPSFPVNVWGTLPLFTLSLFLILWLYIWIKIFSASFSFVRESVLLRWNVTWRTSLPRFRSPLSIFHDRLLVAEDIVREINEIVNIFFFLLRHLKILFPSLFKGLDSVIMYINIPDVLKIGGRIKLRDIMRHFSYFMLE